ncbi:MAG: preprotein translocase subunit SecG [Pseudomonadota bacterium]
MIAVLLTIHILIAASLVGVVLLQRSEGGALGIGGGGGGAFMSGRGAANALTRATSLLAAGFFTTSIALTVLAGANNGEETILDIDPVENSSEEQSATEFSLPSSPEDLGVAPSSAGDATNGAPAADDIAIPTFPEDGDAQP